MCGFVLPMLVVKRGRPGSILGIEPYIQFRGLEITEEKVSPEFKSISDHLLSVNEELQVYMGNVKSCRHFGSPGIE